MLLVKDLRLIICLTCLFTVFSIVIIGEAAAKTYYVDDDSCPNTGSGTSSDPYCKIQSAANLTSAGDTVIVRDGMYNDNSVATKPLTANVVITTGGNASNWITFKSENKWGAKINGKNNTVDYGFFFKNANKYIRIEGFEIYGQKWQGVFGGSQSNNFTAADFITIYNNKFHTIGRWCDLAAATYGHNGIYLGRESDNWLIDSNVFYNIGRLDDNDGCGKSSYTEFYNHDHAIYIGYSYESYDGGEATVKNNIFYDIKHGWGVIVGDKGSAVIVNNTFDSQHSQQTSPPRAKGQVYVKGNAIGTVENNLFIGDNDCAIATGNTAVGTIKNNLTYYSGGNIDLICEGYPSKRGAGGFIISGNIENSNPSFFDIDKNNYNLTSSSEAIDRGLSTYAPSTDHAGNSRPVDGDNDGKAQHDIGAYEFGGMVTDQSNDGIDDDLDGSIILGDEGSESASGNDETNPASSSGNYNFIVKVDPEGTYIDAENYTEDITNQEATSSFIPLQESAQSGYAGSGYLMTSGTIVYNCDNANEGKAFAIHVEEVGTYNAWIRGYGFDDTSDSIFIGIDGTCIGAINPNNIYNQWVWTNNLQKDAGTNTIDITTPGIHTFNIWVKELNFLIDGIYLTKGTEPPPDDIALLDNMPPAPPLALVIE